MYIHTLVTTLSYWDDVNVEANSYIRLKVIVVILEFWMSNNNKAYAEGFLTNLVPQFTPMFTVWLSDESYMDRGIILGRRGSVPMTGRPKSEKLWCIGDSQGKKCMENNFRIVSYINRKGILVKLERQNLQYVHMGLSDI